MNDNAHDSGAHRPACETQAASRRKQRYVAPTLTEFGDMRRLTAAGDPSSASDFFGQQNNMTKVSVG